MSDLFIGQSATITRNFTTEDVAAYRHLTGDSGLQFGEKIETAVPGPLLAGMISTLLGTECPGQGTNWLKQQLTYPRATVVGEPITAVVTITRLRPEKYLVNLQTTCTNAAGLPVCQGEALVFIKDRQTYNQEVSPSM